MTLRETLEAKLQAYADKEAAWVVQVPRSIADKVNAEAAALLGRLNQGQPTADIGGALRALEQKLMEGRLGKDKARIAMAQSLMGKTVRRRSNMEILGKGCGVSKDGKLIVEKPDGKKQTGLNPWYLEEVPENEIQTDEATRA